jgi:PilZ domain-containing protein
MTRTAVPRAEPGVPPELVLATLRIPFVQRAQLTHADSTRDVFLVDLGLQGVFAELDTPLSVGDTAQIRFPLPGNEIPVAALCRVAWRHAGGASPRGLPPGVGLEFVDMSPADRARLREHVVEYWRRAGPSRRFTRPWPTAS